MSKLKIPYQKGESIMEKETSRRGKDPCELDHVGNSIALTLNITNDCSTGLKYNKSSSWGVTFPYLTLITLILF